MTTHVAVPDLRTKAADRHPTGESSKKHRGSCSVEFTSEELDALPIVLPMLTHQLQYKLVIYGFLMATALGTMPIALYLLVGDPRNWKDYQLKEVGRLKLNGCNVKQVTCPAPGHFALYHCGGSYVEIADLRDPANPKVALRDAQVSPFYGDQLIPEMMGDIPSCPLAPQWSGVVRRQQQ